MDDRKYSRALWGYSVMVVVASICAFGTSLLASQVSLNSTVSWILGVIAFVLFIFATAWFSVVLKLKPKQWLVVILLLIFAWVGSVIYLVTRKPNVPNAG